MNQSDQSAFDFHAHDEAETRRLGAALADVLVPGTTIGLIGTLGAGKTRLVQAVASRFGVDVGLVTSPTFVLLHQYTQGRMPIYHFDAYRLQDEEEFLELGPEEYFESAGVTIVEWADRVISCMPEDRLEIEFEVCGESARQYRLVATSAGLEEMLEHLQQLLER